MYTITKTYTDFNGAEVTETAYFHLSKAEILEMELGTAGGAGEKLQKIINSKDLPGLIEQFKFWLLKSYGVKSDDGKRFIKNKELTEAFEQTPLYSEIFMELATDDVAASKFIKGIMPPDLAPEVDKNIKAVPMPQ